MKIQELRNKLEALEVAHKKERSKLILEYCFSNNSVKLGDVVSDHAGSIIVEKINAVKILNDYECAYYGPSLTRQMTPRKNGEKRTIYQSNMKGSPNENL